jgi:hypothetical protein
MLLACVHLFHFSLKHRLEHKKTSTEHQAVILTRNTIVQRAVSAIVHRVHVEGKCLSISSAQSNTHPTND